MNGSFEVMRVRTRRQEARRPGRCRWAKHGRTDTRRPSSFLRSESRANDAATKAPHHTPFFFAFHLTPSNDRRRRHDLLQAPLNGHTYTQALCGSMSCIAVGGDPDDSCANCGKHGIDTVKLKNCTACRLVKYCGVDCQKAHRKQHKKACKQRAAQLKDEQLYSQGHERPEGDFCPICTLPIPLSMQEHSAFMACCMKRICNGCDMAAKKRGMFDCPFCRAPRPDSDTDQLAMIQARVEKKDPEATLLLGQRYFFGSLGLQKDVRKAVELFTKAAELGSVDALFDLGNAYYSGEVVQEDKAKAAEFYKIAAMQGHVESRYQLGCCEGQKGNYDRAVRHFLISAKMGDKDSFEIIKDLFMEGVVAKEQYTQALRGYQDALEEMKSHDRDEAKRLQERYRQSR